MINFKLILIMKKVFLYFSIIFMSIVAYASANEPVFDGRYYNWNVFKFINDNDEVMCYVASYPVKTVGNYKGDREPYFMITYFRSKEKQEVSLYADYKYKIGSLVHIMVDSNKYELVTKDKMAWTKTKVMDKQLIENLLKAKDIKVRSESTKNEYTVDYYTTKGLFVAYNRMMELCK